MEPQTKNKYLKIAAALSAVFALIISGYFFYTNVYIGTDLKKAAETVQTGTDLSQAQIDFRGQSTPFEPFEFKGTLYLSLVKTDSKDALGIYTYSLDQASSSLKALFVDTKGAGGNLNFSASASRDGKKLVFARGKENGSGIPQGLAGDAPIQIYTSDSGGRNVKQITNTPDKYKREPIFNASSTLIAYVAWQSTPPEIVPDPSFPESWATFLTDGKGTVVKISNGNNPIFSLDGKKMLVLKNDGLHSFDISDWKKPLEKGLAMGTVDGRANTFMKIGISVDGKLIAWPSIAAGNVVVSKIDWGSLTLDPFLIIKTEAFWTTFSPDGRYLAVNEWRKDDVGNNYSVIMGYDLSNGISEKMIDLSEYSKSTLWLGSWK